MDTRLLQELGYPLISQAQIDGRAKEIAEQLFKAFKKSNPVFVCIEKGGRNWANKVISFLKKYNFEFEEGALIAKSYVSDKSSGLVRVTNYAGPDLSNRNVVFLEDILDTLHTVTALNDWAKKQSAASVTMCAMVFKKKPTNILWQIKHLFGHRLVKYVGFWIPDLFVVGTGLDYNEFGRDLLGIYVVSATAKFLIDTIREEG